MSTLSLRISDVVPDSIDQFSKSAGGAHGIQAEIVEKDGRGCTAFHCAGERLRNRRS